MQRWFTKRIKSFTNLSFDERSFKLDNERVELRRLRADLLMCYKKLHHFVDIPQDDFLTISHIKVTRGNSFKLIGPNSRVDAGPNFCLVSIIKVWNQLSDVIYLFINQCT